MKIIREGNPKQIECSCCGSLLEYEPKDIQESQTHINEYTKYVICPICDMEMDV